MQLLSDTLEAMKLAEGSQKVALHGSTTNDGQIALSPRQQPLTENDLTQIASRMLLKSPTLCWSKRKIYGRKQIGNDWFENEPIGEEDVADIQLFYKDNLPVKVIEAALRPSPISAIRTHLTRLSLHKMLGSSQDSRAILLVDYAEALRDFPEFVVFIACKSFWENDEGQFYPKIKQLSALCEIIEKSFEQKLPAKQITEMKTTSAEVYATPKDNPVRRTLCEYLISVGEPDYFDQVRMWSNYDLEKHATHKGYKP